MIGGLCSVAYDIYLPELLFSSRDLAAAKHVTYTWIIPKRDW
jgi:hypothetical protein